MSIVQCISSNMQWTNNLWNNGFLLLMHCYAIQLKMRMLTFSGCIWPAQDRHDNPHKFDPLHEHEPTKKQNDQNSY